MLELRNVTRAYGRKHGIFGIDLVVPPGSRTAIVGPSGSGKTTLLRLIAGFEAADSGTILLDGRSLEGAGSRVPTHQRDIGYVTQEGALFPHMTLAANVAFGMPRATPQREQRVTELLQMVGLSPDLRNRRPHEISGGQQQRIALARALARRPKLMLLDEPFSALDTNLRDSMRDMVSEVLARAGITTILVTHDQAEALAFATQIVVLRDGAVADIGDPQRLYLQPANIQTARFLGEAIMLRAELANGIAQTSLGPLSASGSVQGSGWVMLRPEQVGIAPVVLGAAGRARVVRKTYQGASWRLTIELLADPSTMMSNGIDETAGALEIIVPYTETYAIGDAVNLGVRGKVHAFR